MIGGERWNTFVLCSYVLCSCLHKVQLSKHATRHLFRQWVPLPYQPHTILEYPLWVWVYIYNAYFYIVQHLIGLFLPVLIQQFLGRYNAEVDFLCVRVFVCSTVWVFFYFSRIIRYAFSSVSHTLRTWCPGFFLRVFWCPTLCWSFGHHMPGAAWWAFPECCNFFLKECLEFFVWCRGGTNMGPKGLGHTRTETHGLIPHMF